MIFQTKPQNPSRVTALPEPSFATKLFASALFSGYSPIASGTVGSAVALAFYALPGFESPLILGVVTLIVCLLGIKTSTIMEQRYGHDPAEVTIDEVVGMWLSLMFLPKKLFVVLAAFFLFRFFDIIKPFPARKFDSMHGGVGIMMDDVIAGIYANIVLQVVLMIPLLKSFFLQ
jgi:phosphatidylglycerophosphatase A